MSEAVVTAVADAKGVSPVAVTPPLYDVIDPEALEAVVASMTSRPDEPAGHVEFPYNGFRITVTGDGRVSVTPNESHRQ
ncbi:HalOD1 output domain-containing protein [Halorussus salinisoli]|uniref:HalOD1 output domain-containing protein n=1 Tax=Halorussus salinisoli TaxID=2558242 RepID=UPI002A910495|nr:HalOD1 output domain-containing protein [Halorussus salinisoli]